MGKTRLFTTGRYLWSVLAVGAGVAASVPCPAAHAAEPSSREQYMLELVNRMRIDPQGELMRLANLTGLPDAPAWASPRSDDPRVHGALVFFGVSLPDLLDQWSSLAPAPPVAWSGRLHDAAAAHNQLMIQFDDQSHRLPGERPFLSHREPDRLDAVGYDWQTGGENVFAFAHNIFHGHAGFAIDWGDDDHDKANGFGTGIQNPAGHRLNIMDPAFREVGIAIADEITSGKSIGPLVITQNFASENHPDRAGLTGPFLTGVAFDDRDGDGFYSEGEGLGALFVDAFLPGSDQPVVRARTFASGGYSLPLDPGVYDVRFAGGGIEHVIPAVDFTAGHNVKLDAIDPAPVTRAPGDADGDGDIDGFDLGLWQQQFGGREDLFTADFDFDFDVDAFDLAVWQLAFTGDATTLVSVPEPASLISVGLALTLAPARRRRRPARTVSFA